MPAPLWGDLVAWLADRTSRRSMAWAGRMARMTATRSRTTVLGGIGAAVGVAQVRPDRGGWGAAAARTLDSRDSRDSRNFPICYSFIVLYITALSPL
jgi:hypothetical protein